MDLRNELQKRVTDLEEDLKSPRRSRVRSAMPTSPEGRSVAAGLGRTDALLRAAADFAAGPPTRTLRRGRSDSDVYVGRGWRDQDEDATYVSRAKRGIQLALSLLDSGDLDSMEKVLRGELAMKVCGADGRGHAFGPCKLSCLKQHAREALEEGIALVGAYREQQRKRCERLQSKLVQVRVDLESSNSEPSSLGSGGGASGSRFARAAPRTFSISILESPGQIQLL